MVFIVLAWLASSILILFELQILGQIVQYLLTAILFSMVIVFQPELRKLLVQIGQTKFVTGNFFFNKINKEEKETNVIKEIIEAVKYCSRVKRGALIVIQKTEDKALYHDVGTMINADVSAELILTIFFPNTPLHDGALVVHKDKIVAAGVKSEFVQAIPSQVYTGGKITPNVIVTGLNGEELQKGEDYVISYGST